MNEEGWCARRPMNKVNNCLLYSPHRKEPLFACVEVAWLSSPKEGFLEEHASVSTMKTSLDLDTQELKAARRGHKKIILRT